MKKITLIIAAIGFQLLATCFNAKAQFTVINDFGTSIDAANGAEPVGTVTPSVTGDTLFGTTALGGADGTGSVFYITSDGSVYDTIHTFTDNNDGGYPEGTLTRIGNKLYGMAQLGGAKNHGVIFSLNTNGTGFDTLHSFGWAIDGGHGNPYGSLTLSPSGTTFYGMTSSGGAHNDGFIFSINVNGTGYDTLHSFSTAANDGVEPYENLTLSVTGDTLFGMTNVGGLNFAGVIFSIKTNGTGFDTLHCFGSGNDGQNPYGSLTLVGSKLYGMTYYGGTNNYGVIFRINSNGTGYDTLRSFGYPIDGGGGNPEGSLTLSPNGKLYGLTYHGGVNAGRGSIFVVDPKTSVYDTLYSFHYHTDGGDPDYGNDVVLMGDTLYGMLQDGGATGNGTVYKYTSASICNMYATIDSGNATAAVTATGGSGPYTYSWTGGRTSASLTGLTAGTYTCTVTDHHGCSQVLTTHVISTVGIQNISGITSGVSVYPNPSNGNFQLKITNYELGITSNVEVYNTLGQVVYSQSNINSTSNIDLSSQANGIYLYRVMSENGNLLGEGKLVLQK